MKKIILVLLTLAVADCSKEYPENEQLQSKLDEMKTCLKYNTQEVCETQTGIHVFKHQSGQYMMKDPDSGNYIMPMQGQNGQPVYQNLGQQYPTPQVVNNYIPSGGGYNNSSNESFMFGTLMGMHMGQMMSGGGYHYYPPSYRGNTNINNTTVNRYDRPYNEKEYNKFKDKKNFKEEVRRRQQEAQVKKEHRSREQAQRNANNTNYQQKPTYASTGNPSLRTSSSSSRNSSYSPPQRSSYKSPSSSGSSSRSSSSSRRR